jgi:uncharacterized protein YbbK (DUF523 family)
MAGSGIILVSACLVGRPARYDGRFLDTTDFLAFLEGKRWIAVCPEMLGGLGWPRPPADLEGGDGYDVLAGRARVVNADGVDQTREFIQGAQAVLDMALSLDVEAVYLKDRSPSCGVHPMVDERGRRRGRGVLAALLAENGLPIIEVVGKKRSEPK